MGLGLTLLTGLGTLPALLILWAFGATFGVVLIAEALERTRGLAPATFGGAFWLACGFVVLLVVIEMARWFAPKAGQARTARLPRGPADPAARRGAPAVLAVHPAGPLRPRRHRPPGHPDDDGAALRAGLRPLRAADRVRRGDAAPRAMALALRPALRVSQRPGRRRRRRGRRPAADLHGLHAARSRGRRPQRALHSDLRARHRPPRGRDRPQGVDGGLAVGPRRRLDADPRDHRPVGVPATGAPARVPPAPLRRALHCRRQPPRHRRAGRALAGRQPPRRPRDRQRGRVRHSPQGLQQARARRPPRRSERVLLEVGQEQLLQGPRAQPAGPVQPPRHARRPAATAAWASARSGSSTRPSTSGPACACSTRATATSSSATSRARPPRRSPRT
jgi:hypothetical protein